MVLHKSIIGTTRITLRGNNNNYRVNITEHDQVKVYKFGNLTKAVNEYTTIVQNILDYQTEFIFMGEDFLT